MTESSFEVGPEFRLQTLLEIGMVDKKEVRPDQKDVRVASFGEWEIDRSAIGMSRLINNTINKLRGCKARIYPNLNMETFRNGRLRLHGAQELLQRSVLASTRRPLLACRYAAAKLLLSSIA